MPRVNAPGLIAGDTVYPHVCGTARDLTFGPERTQERERESPEKSSADTTRNCVSTKNRREEEKTLTSFTTSGQIVESTF